MITPLDWFSGITLVGVLGIIWKNARDNDSKINRVFSRLDEVKNFNDEKFTHKDVCEILHKQIDSKLTEISTDIKILLKNNGHNN